MFAFGFALAPRILKLNAVGFGFADVPWSATLIGLVDLTLLSKRADCWGFCKDDESEVEANSLVYS